MLVAILEQIRQSKADIQGLDSVLEQLAGSSRSLFFTLLSLNLFFFFLVHSIFYASEKGLVSFVQTFMGFNAAKSK